MAGGRSSGDQYKDGLNLSDPWGFPGDGKGFLFKVVQCLWSCGEK